MASFSAHSISAKDKDEATLVRRWLQGLQAADSETTICQTTGLPFPSIKSPPTTPLRQPQLVERYEEASPTDSAFSCGSIFDASGLVLASPASLSHAVTRRPDYAETEASSTCTEDQESGGQSRTHLSKLNSRKSSLSCSPSSSLDSSAPPSASNIPANEEDTKKAASCRPFFKEITSVARGMPQVIFVTSCLQCTLAGLTCTRTPPACSRCQRHNRSDLCLLQRRRLRTERIDGREDFNSTPVLLRIQSCDEALHARKIALAEKLLQEWSIREERKNWILPRIDEGRGDFASAPPRVRRLHPGEGQGRLVYMALRAVEESLTL